MSPDLTASESTEIIEASDLTAFPGAVDAHQHWGIYNAIQDDADSESRASAEGGVTTWIT